MNETVEILANPVIKAEDLDAEDLNFLEAARHADRGEDIPAELVTSKPAETVEPELEAEIEELKPETAGERARDPITGKFIKTPEEIAAETPVSEAVDASKATPESEYARVQREQKEKAKERQNRSWEALNRQKDEIAQERERLAQDRQRLQQSAQPKLQPREFSSAQLLQASQDFKAEAKLALDAGDYDKFNEQTGLADKAFENAAQFYELEQQERTQTAQQKHKEVWEGHVKEAWKAEPDLASPDSILSKEVMSILEQSGKELWMIPDGFKKAVEIAKLRIDAKDAPSLREQLKTLKAENNRLNGLTSISGSGPTAAPAKKTFDSMTDEEQDAYLTRQAHTADGL